MRKMPKSLLVFGETIPIELKKGMRDEGTLGEYNKETKIITMDADLPNDELMLTLLHEMGHAIEDRVSISQAIDKDVFEIITDTFAKCLVENFSIKPL